MQPDKQGSNSQGVHLPAVALLTMQPNVKPKTHTAAPIIYTIRWFLPML